MRRINKLGCIAGGIDIAGKSQTQAAEQSVCVLDGLHKLLVSAAEDATPDGLQLSILITRRASCAHTSLPNTFVLSCVPIPLCRIIVLLCPVLKSSTCKVQQHDGQHLIIS